MQGLLPNEINNVYHNNNNRESPVYKYDFTLQKGDIKTHDDIIPTLRKLAKNWVFQEEKAPTTGTLHYQGRMSLHVKMRTGELITSLIGTLMKGAHISKTSSNCKEFNYVMKETSRVAGPWASDKKYQKQEEPNEIRGKQLYPWQQQIVKTYKEGIEDRKVNVLIDLAGGLGKGFLRKYLGYHKHAFPMPTNLDAKRMVQFAFKFHEEYKHFILDIPRTELSHDKKKNGNKNHEMWRAIEQIKDGNLVEERYESKFVQMEKNPVIWVFTNDVPPLQTLSKDRWALWLVDPDNNELIEYEEQACIAITEHIQTQRQEKLDKEELEKPKKLTRWSKKEIIDDNIITLLD